jgi:polysaccharide export outer membrane protein
MSLMGKINIFMFCVCCLLGLSTQSSAATNDLGPGDIVSIEVWGEPEISGTYKVSQLGNLHKAWLPEVVVSGKSEDDARKAFEAMLKKFFVKPQLKFEVVEFRSRSVRLVGAVPKPGDYTLGAERNLMSVLLRAGGLSQNAEGQAIVVRLADENSEELKRETIDARALLNRVDLSQDKVLLSGDVIYIPVSSSNNGNSTSDGETIIVTGAVKNIGAFPFRAGYTALNAIIDAGGFTKFAAPGKGRVVRGKGKAEKVIRIDLGAVVNRGDKTKNVDLMPGDIVVVPESIF